MFSYSVQLQCIATVVIFLDLVYQSACTSFLVQVNPDIVQEATELTTKQCCLLATGTIMEVREVFLCLENQVLMQVEKRTQAVAALLLPFLFSTLTTLMEPILYFSFWNPYF